MAAALSYQRQPVICAAIVQTVFLVVFSAGSNPMEYTSNNGSNNITLKFLAATILVYSLLGIFSGLPDGANLGAFVAGLVILFLGIAALMGLAWYLVVKPLPETLAPSRKLPLSHGLRQGVALFLTMMSAVGIGGGLWDITWHVRSGLPFGEDFFWAPHQFIYVALTAPIIVAAFVWSRLLQNSSGTMRQRFKADVPLTLIIIGGIAMLFTLPADPLWHVIYGEDLTGLSVPHIVFSISSTFTSLGTLSILLSYTPMRQTWASILKLNRMEVLIIASLAFSLNSLLMPTLGDWEAITLSTSALPRLPALVAARPDWAMPFLAAFVAIYPTSMALQITKRFGTASLLWLIAAVLRSGLFLAFGYGDSGMATMFLILPFVISLDIVVWYRVSRNQPLNSVFIAAAATIAGAIAVLPQISLSFTDPILSARNVPAILAAIFVGALTAAYMGHTLGRVVSKTVRFELPVKRPIVAKSVVRTMSVLTVTIVIVAVYFIITAKMPSA
jgi:hypothetical protein